MELNKTNCIILKLTKGNTSTMIFKPINPYSQLVIAEYEVLTTAQLNQKIHLSASAFKN